MKKILLILLVCALAAPFVFANGQAAASEEKIVITFAHMNAVGDPIDRTAQKFKELVEAKVGDQVEVRVHPAGQLGDDKQNFEGMGLGTVHVTMSNPDMLSNFVPEYVVFALPYMFADWDHVERAMDGDVGAELDQMLLDQEGIRNLAWLHNGFRNMTTKTKQIRTMADFKGVKFRSPEIPVYMKMFQAIGATPTPIPWPEVYNAMKQGIVDGMETTPTGFVGAKIYEVSKYVYLTNHLYTAANVLMSDKFYQDLPRRVQKAIDDSAAELEPWQRQMVIEDTEGTYDTLRDKGMVIVEFDTTEMREAVKPVWVELTADAPKAIEFAEKIGDLIE
jgi:tripartite ATP-independent transporter DctP family solute receptor